MIASEAVGALAALAQDHRLDVFRQLVQTGPDGLSAGVIAENLGISPSSLSFHLAQLSHAGLVTQQRQGRSIIYRADIAAMSDLLAYLTENCCGGEPCLPVASACAEAANG